MLVVTPAVMPAVVPMGIAVMVVIVSMLMMMIVRVGLIVALGMLPVSAGLRIERRVHGRKARAEPTQHALDHMVAANAQPIADNLHIDMTVADMPGESRQLVTVRRGNFDQRLGPADDAHNAAVVEREAVAVAQRGRLRQVE
jgi:hypothetical protein